MNAPAKVIVLAALACGVGAVAPGAASAMPVANIGIDLAPSRKTSMPCACAIAGAAAGGARAAIITAVTATGRPITAIAMAGGIRIVTAMAGAATAAGMAATAIGADRRRYVKNGPAVHPRSGRFSPAAHTAGSPYS